MARGGSDGQEERYGDWLDRGPRAALLIMLDKPTTVPGLREQGQINLRTRRGSCERDDLRSARGMVIAALIGLLVIGAAWAIALLLM